MWTPVQRWHLGKEFTEVRELARQITGERMFPAEGAGHRTALGGNVLSVFQEQYQDQQKGEQWEWMLERRGTRWQVIKLQVAGLIWTYCF